MGLIRLIHDDIIIGNDLIIGNDDDANDDVIIGNDDVIMMTSLAMLMSSWWHHHLYVITAHTLSLLTSLLTALIQALEECSSDDITASKFDLDCIIWLFLLISLYCRLCFIIKLITAFCLFETQFAANMVKTDPTSSKSHGIDTHDFNRVESSPMMSKRLTFKREYLFLKAKIKPC